MDQCFKRNTMQKKIQLIAFVLFISSLNVFGQVYEVIEKEAANIFLMSDDSKLSISFENLKSVLFSDFDKTDLERTHKVLSESIDSLRNCFTLLKSESENVSVDSALFLFNNWYLQLSNTFYDYCKENFFSSPKTKILLFSTSMSCYCTLEMCKNQLIDILNFVKKNGNQYDYWIVDSYEHNELQLKYETYFAPSVIVFGSNNEVLFKIEYDEKMIENLAVRLFGLNGNKKG